MLWPFISRLRVVSFVILMQMIHAIQVREFDFGHDPFYKIAFLFMTPGHMPFEKVWNEFFRDVSSAEYSLYIHTTINGFRFPKTSLWYQREIDTVESEWGYLLQPERALLKVALRDRKNDYFCLVSESSIPLVSFHSMKEVLSDVKKSIVDACERYNHRSFWNHALDKISGMKRKLWRKSSQFFALTRKHAVLVVSDEVLYSAFRDMKFADEHYIPVLLAWKRLENETTCSNGFTYANFAGRSDPHPVKFHSKDIDSSLFERLRREDKRTKKGAYKCSGTKICHFMARKFADSTVDKLMEHITDILYVYRNNVTAKSVTAIRDKCIHHAQTKIIGSFSSFFQTNSTVLYFDPVTNEDLGDSVLLLQGSLNMLGHFNSSISFCGDVQSSYKDSNLHIPRCKEDKLGKLAGGGNFTIYYHPGGNWGDLYRSIQEYRLEILKYASLQNIPFISGQQSIFYGNLSIEQEDKKFIRESNCTDAVFSFR